MADGCCAAEQFNKAIKAVKVQTNPRSVTFVAYLVFGSIFLNSYHGTGKNFMG